MSGDEAFETIRRSANVLSEIPKLSLAWSTAMLAYDVYVLRDYSAGWYAIELFAAAGALSLLVACAGLALRIIALKNIEATDARELFFGRIPDPAAPSFQERLARYASLYRIGGSVALPSLLSGIAMTATMTAVLVVYQLVK